MKGFLFVAVLAAAFALLTIFFSTRRELFAQIFVPLEDSQNDQSRNPSANEGDAEFRKSMRRMAVIEGILSVVFLFIWLTTRRG